MPPLHLGKAKFPAVRSRLVTKLLLLSLLQSPATSRQHCIPPGAVLHSPRPGRKHRHPPRGRGLSTTPVGGTSAGHGPRLLPVGSRSVQSVATVARAAVGILQAVPGGECRRSWRRRGPVHHQVGGEHHLRATGPCRGEAAPAPAQVYPQSNAATPHSTPAPANSLGGFGDVIKSFPVFHACVPPRKLWLNSPAVVQEF